MVTAATSFSRNGVSDWIIQRVSAVVLLAYTLFILGFLVMNPDLQYSAWRDLFSLTCVRIFSLLALLSIAAHAWIGFWSVTTDYLTTRMIGGKANVLRWLAQAACGIVLFTYVVWGIQILWGM